MRRFRGQIKFYATMVQRVLLLTAAVWLVGGFGIPTAGSDPQKHVLLFYENRGDMLANIVVDRAIREVLNDEFDVNLDVRSEYFEVPALADHNPEALLNWLRYKYAETTFDVIVAVGSNALRFASMHEHDLFRGARFVFWGRKEGIKNWQSESPLTGVVAPEKGYHVKATLDFIRTLQPDLRQLILVSGASADDREWEATARSELRRYEDRFTITYLTAPTLETLESRLAHLPERSAIIFLSMSEDAAGRQLSNPGVLSKIVLTASAPIYVKSTVHLDTGAAGGPIVSQEALANETAKVVARLLHGQRIEDIPIREGPLTPMVNWKQLQRWKIPENRIPPGTVIIQRDPSMWELYKWHIIGMLSLCGIEGILIIALLIHWARRKRAEKSLSENRQLLQSTVEALKQAHHAQQQLTGLLLRAQDDERRRIARDLHDVTVQNLATIKAAMTRVRRTSNNLDAKALEKIDEGLALSDQVIHELRTLSYLLHPPLLDELGLVPALQWFIRGFSERSRIQVEFVVNGNIGRLPTDIETTLFRVAQESMANIHRHSGSPSATIRLAQDQGRIVLEITDQGRGISRTRQSSNRGAPPPGVGIMGMGERIRQLGGELEIQSSAHGTTVCARLPSTEEILCHVS
jgi:signal transduction histidine kinase